MKERQTDGHSEIDRAGFLGLSDGENSAASKLNVFIIYVKGRGGVTVYS